MSTQGSARTQSRSIWLANPDQPGSKRANQAESLDPLYAYYGIHGSNTYRVSFSSFYDTFVLEAVADLNSDNLSSYGLVTLVSSPWVSWDNSITHSMKQDTTMIFSPIIFNFDYESVLVQIWTDPLPECLFQVVSFHAIGDFVHGAMVKQGILFHILS
jgi:hypothetical protein